MLRRFLAPDKISNLNLARFSLPLAPILSYSLFTSGVNYFSSKSFRQSNSALTEKELHHLNNNINNIKQSIKQNEKSLEELKQEETKQVKLLDTQRHVFARALGEEGDLSKIIAFMQSLEKPLLKKYEYDLIRPLIENNHNDTLISILSFFPTSAVRLAGELSIELFNEELAYDLLAKIDLGNYGNINNFAQHILLTPIKLLIRLTEKISSLESKISRSEVPTKDDESSLALLKDQKNKAERILIKILNDGADLYMELYSSGPTPIDYVKNYPEIREFLTKHSILNKESPKPFR